MVLPRRSTTRDGDARELRHPWRCSCRAATIGKVVRDFRAALPDATVYVYDNASTDGTADIAAAAGAVVRHAPIAGKGRVVRRMFADIDAAIYVIADGDDTYQADAAPAMIERLRQHHLDMVIGTRVVDPSAREAFRPGHRFGNWLLSRSVSRIFGDGSSDMLTGYRVLSRRFVKSFPALSTGFETETEITVHALELCLPFEDMPTVYQERPSNSVSKLRTIPDGVRILKLILALCKDYRPLRFFGSVSAAAALLALAIWLSASGHLHQWRPAALAVAVLVGTATLSMMAGVLLDSLRRNSREMRRMLYLAVDPISGSAGQDVVIWPPSTQARLAAPAPSAAHTSGARASQSGAGIPIHGTPSLEFSGPAQ